MPISTIDQKGLTNPLTSVAANTVTSAAATALTLQSAGTTAVTIDTSQNVGIGTSSPGAKLDVLRASTNTTAFDEPQIRGINSATATANQRVDIAMRWQDGTYNGTGGLSMVRESATARSGALTFAPIDSSGNGTERMRIESNGNVLVGTTSNPSGQKLRVTGGSPAFEVSDSTVSTSTTGYFGFQVRGDLASVNLSRSTGNAVAFFNSANASGINGSTVGIISITTSATTYATSSDYRLKENITPMTGALATVAQLKPVTYNWKVDGSSGQGFIAHELQAVVPDCVVGDKDAVKIVDDLDEEGKVIGTKEVPEYQGIDTSFLVATLTAAIQELKAEFDAYKASHP